ncbi:MAG: EpsG family protein [Ruminococcaceae bacterium]|nr:EpsG family protein [Oscillospiraceae bacterium]
MVEMGRIESLFLYLVIYITSAYFMSKSNVIEKKKPDIYMIVAVLLPVLLAAKRYYVGTDYESYYYMYRRMSRTSFRTWVANEMSLEGTPFGIWFVARIAFQFRSYEMFYGLLAAIIYVPTALVLKKQYPKDISFLAILMLLTGQFTTGFNITKQVAAVVMLIAGLQYVHERKFWKFALFLFLAFCFHPSALIAAPIYFLWKPKDAAFSFKRTVFILGCIVFINFLPQFLTALGGRFESYTAYTDEISNRSFYMNAGWVVFFFLMRRKYIEFDKRNDLYVTMVLIGLILNVSGFSSPYVKRIAMYYSFPQSFLIFQIPYLFDTEEKPLFKALVFIYTIAMFVINFYVLEFSDIIPYAYGGV